VSELTRLRPTEGAVSRLRPTEGAVSRLRPTEGAIPLRPLTFGELLDAAVALLRTRAWPLVGVGVLLAVIEQALLFPLRSFADQDISMLPATGRLNQFAALMIGGFTTEAMVISTLAALAAGQAGPALLGRFAPMRRPLRRGSIAVVVVAVGIVAAITTTPFLLLEPLQVLGFFVAGICTLAAWPLPYGLIGLAAPAVVVEHRGPGSALVRSLRLAGRAGMRAAFIRVLGWSSWTVARLALILATRALVSLIWGDLPSSTWDRVLLAAAALVVNAVAYPVLGCLDVVLLLEGRMRSEGLDIALRWAMRRGMTPSLEAPR
jgi:hypothetical protein